MSQVNGSGILSKLLGINKNPVEKPSASHSSVDKMEETSSFALEAKSNEVKQRLVAERKRKADINDWSDLIVNDLEPIIKQLISGQGNTLSFNDTRRLYGAVLIVDGVCVSHNDVIVVGLKTPEGIGVMQFAESIIRQEGIYNVKGKYFVTKHMLQKIYHNDIQASSSSVEENYDESDKWIVAFRDNLFSNVVTRKGSDLHFTLKNELMIQVRIGEDLYMHEQSLPYDKGIAFLRSLAGDFTGADVGSMKKMGGVKTLSILKGNKSINYTVRFEQSSGQSVSDTRSALDVVLRFNSDEDMMSLCQIGFDSQAQAVFDTISRRTRGVIIIVGATGSGKTTTLNTLYDTIQTNSGNSKKIISIENPCEGFVPGVNKQPLFPSGSADNDESEAVIASVQAMNSVLRQDPDVVGFGEIREKTLATKTYEAAITGHLVCSTFHVARWVEVYRRMIEYMGLHPSIVTGAETTEAIVVQALKSRVCGNCGLKHKEYAESCNHFQKAELQSFINNYCDESDVSRLRFRRPHLFNDCKVCNGTGVLGRKKLLYEIFVPADHPDCVKLISERKYDEALDLWESKRSTQSSLTGYSIYNRAVDYAKNGEICANAAIYFIGGS